MIGSPPRPATAPDIGPPAIPSAVFLRPLPWLVPLLVWEGLAQLASGPLVAGPSDISAYAWANAGLLWRATLATTQAAAWGFLWGNLAAALLASAVILAPRTERLAAALALLVFCLPLVATGPILRVLFGPGTGPQITLGALAVYYTTYLALLVGLRAVPQAWLELPRTYGRGAWVQLRIIRARAALPYLIAGLQIAAPAALLGAMIGEFTGAERGLGVLTLRAMRGLDADATWTLALIASGLALAAHTGLGLLGRRLTGHAPPLLLTAGTMSPARPLWQRLAGLFAIAGVVLVLWQGALDAFGLNGFFAKRPGDVLTYLASDPQARATLLNAIGETLVLALPGYLAGLVLGAGLAAATVLSPGLGRAILPVAVALRSIPIITTGPLLILLLGRGAVGSVTVVAAMIFFPSFTACLHGLRQMPGQVSDVFASYRASRWRILSSARIPAMWPAFFASARMAVPAALLAATTTEWLATGRGIGVLMAMTASTSDYNMLWSATAVLSLVAVLLYGAVAWIERRVLRKYGTEQT